MYLHMFICNCTNSAKKPQILKMYIYIHRMFLLPETYIYISYIYI
jgi:hypothetical protein